MMHINDDDLDAELDLGEEEVEEEPLRYDHLVKVKMPGRYNTGRDQNIDDEFHADRSSAIGWHEMEYVEMVDPTYEEATAEAEE